MAGAVEGGIDAVLRDLEKGELNFRSFVDAVEVDLARLASREAHSLIDGLLGIGRGAYPHALLATPT